jgi:hypothetical protein
MMERRAEDRAYDKLAERSERLTAETHRRHP